MNRVCHKAALAALLVVSTAAAEDKPAGTSPKPAEVIARLHDGTVVRKAFLRDGVVVVTRFGKLTVPAAEIRRIEFGRHLSAEATRQLEEAVRQLGSDEYKVREGAGKRLVALGARAYPALQAAARSPDKEVAARARAAAEQIRKEVPAEQLSLPENDVVYTRDCVLTGRVEGEALQARSSSLGELSLRFAELRSLHSGAVERAELALDAGQFTAPGKWADSGVTVEPGVGLTVSASGRVDLVPAQAGQHLSGPAGYPGAAGDGGYQAGTLLGRFGEDGPVFMLGQRFEAPSGKGGRLYLRIVPINGAPAPAGSYRVKVSAGPGVEVRTASGPPPVPAVYSAGLNPYASIPAMAPAVAPPPLPAVPAPDVPRRAPS